MRTICITGLAGFIGFHTALALAKQGDRVVGFDNFDPFYSVALKQARALELARHGVICETIDLTDKKNVENFFHAHSPQFVIHLGAQAGVRHSIENPLKFVNSNITGFVNILEILKETPTCPLIFASSSSVYGMNSKVPFAEDDRTDHPVSLYGATKKCNELMGYAYHHLYKIPMTGLRFFTVYGPWGRPDMACWLFTKAIFEGTSIRLFNEGRMERDFTYIDDIVQGILASVEQTKGFDIYNLGGSGCHDLNQFVAQLEKTIGKKAKIDLLPMQPGDVLCTHADISLSHSQLNFTPRTPLDMGIAKFIQWYREYHHC